MKLKVYDKNAQQRIQKPRVTFSPKANSVRFNSHAVTLMDVKAGDTIAIAADEENPEDWYILKNTENGIPLCTTKNNELCFNCKNMINDFFNTFLVRQAIALPIAKQPIEHEQYGTLWVILTVPAREAAAKALRK